MSIITGIGADMELISRFRDLPVDKHKAFYDRVFTKGEIAYCRKYADPYPHFAVRFCAKEAAVKALGKPLDLKKIEVRKKSNAIQLYISGAQNIGACVSLTHTKEHALAFVLLTREK